MRNQTAGDAVGDEEEVVTRCVDWEYAVPHAVSQRGRYFGSGLRLGAFWEAGGAYRLHRPLHAHSEHV